MAFNTLRTGIAGEIAAGVGAKKLFLVGEAGQAVTDPVVLFTLDLAGIVDSSSNDLRLSLSGNLDILGNSAFTGEVKFNIEQNTAAAPTTWVPWVPSPIGIPLSANNTSRAIGGFNLYGQNFSGGDGTPTQVRGVLSGTTGPATITSVIPLILEVFTNPGIVA